MLAKLLIYNIIIICMIRPLYSLYMYTHIYISMIPKYLYDLNYFISIYKYIVFYKYILVIHCYI